MYQSRKERREAEKKESLPISNPGSFAEPAMTARTPTIKQPDIFLEPVKSANFDSTSNWHKRLLGQRETTDCRQH
jgi:hypothetical protein